MTFVIIAAGDGWNGGSDRRDLALHPGKDFGISTLRVRRYSVEGDQRVLSVFQDLIRECDEA